MTQYYLDYKNKKLTLDNRLDPDIKIDIKRSNKDTIVKIGFTTETDYHIDTEDIIKLYNNNILFTFYECYVTFTRTWTNEHPTDDEICEWASYQYFRGCQL